MASDEHLDSSKYHLNAEAASDLDERAERLLGLLYKVAAQVSHDDPLSIPELIEKRHIDSAELIIQAAVFPESQSKKRIGPLPSAPTKTAPRVFVSHAIDDVDLAIEIKNRLAERQFDAFVAGESIRGGRRWQKSIFDAIRECQVACFLITPAFIDSKWCQYEIGAARCLKKPLLSALQGVKPSQLPDPLREFQALPTRTTTQLSAFVKRLVRMCQ